MQVPDLKKLTDYALEASLDAGERIMYVYKKADFSITTKEDQSPLTLADREAHLVITRQLQATGLPVLSEEGQQVPYAERSQWADYWLIDPLDGTKEFIRRHDEFTVNIALVRQGRPVVGVVYAPALDRLYWTEGPVAKCRKGADAPKTISVNGRQDVQVIVASTSHRTPETDRFISRYPGAEIISMGSSLKFLLVAEGMADVYPRYAPTMEWDTAAAQAVLEAAGGRVLQYGTEQPLKYNKENLLNPWFIAGK
jgi:3'(2'), 5'-bisphosphate nucleotidase